MKAQSENQSTKDQPTEWLQLEPGALKQAAHRQRSFARRREWIRGSVAVTGILLGLMWILIPRSEVSVREYHYGGISCSEVKANAHSYLGKKLDESTRQKAAEHLQICGPCRMYFRRIESQISTGIHARHDVQPSRSRQRKALIDNSRSISLAFGLRNR